MGFAYASWSFILGLDMLRFQILDVLVWRQIFEVNCWSNKWFQGLFTAVFPDRSKIWFWGLFTLQYLSRIISRYLSKSCTHWHPLNSNFSQLGCNYHIRTCKGNLFTYIWCLYEDNFFFLTELYIICFP